MTLPSFLLLKEEFILLRKAPESSGSNSAAVSHSVVLCNFLLQDFFDLVGARYDN